MWKKEPLRRKTVYYVPPIRPHFENISSLVSFDESVEDHIYDEIDPEDNESDDSEKETEEKSFLSLISSERRKNLRFYGFTDWDFGTEMI